MARGLGGERLERVVAARLEEPLHDRGRAQVLAQNRRSVLGAELFDRVARRPPRARELDLAGCPRVLDPLPLAVRRHEVALLAVDDEEHRSRVGTAALSSGHGEDVPPLACETEAHQWRNQRVEGLAPQLVHGRIGGAAAQMDPMVTIEDVRALASRLPRSYEAFVRGRVKFRVGWIVYIVFSRDERVMGFAFPREEREALLQMWPEKFLPPEPVD